MPTSGRRRSRQDELGQPRELEEQHVPGPQRLGGCGRGLDHGPGVGDRQRRQAAHPVAVGAGQVPGHGRPPVVADDVEAGRSGRVRQGQDVAGQPFQGVGPRRPRAGSGGVAPLIRRQGAVAGRGEWAGQRLPAVAIFREAVEQDDGRPVRRPPCRSRRRSGRRGRIAPSGSGLGPSGSGLVLWAVRAAGPAGPCRWTCGAGARRGPSAGVRRRGPPSRRPAAATRRAPVGRRGSAGTTQATTRWPHSGSAAPATATSATEPDGSAGPLRPEPATCFPRR